MGNQIPKDSIPQSETPYAERYRQVMTAIYSYINNKPWSASAIAAVAVLLTGYLSARR